MPKKQNSQNSSFKKVSGRYSDVHLFKLGPTSLSNILEYLENPIDKFHFSAVTLQSPMMRRGFSKLMPRCIFKKIREIKKKPPYKHPPTLKKAVKMTSAWISRQGFCWDCLKFPKPVHVDITRDDNHPRCYDCLLTHYRYKNNAPRCPCGSYLELSRHSNRNVSSERTYYLILSCGKKNMWDNCKNPNESSYTNYLHASYVKEEYKKRFVQTFGHSYTTFDPDTCIDSKQITDPQNYWSVALSQHRKELSIYLGLLI